MRDITSRELSSLPEEITVGNSMIGVIDAKFEYHGVPIHLKVELNENAWTISGSLDEGPLALSQGISIIAMEVIVTKGGEGITAELQGVMLWEYESKKYYFTGKLEYGKALAVQAAFDTEQKDGEKEFSLSVGPAQIVISKLSMNIEIEGKEWSGVIDGTGKIQVSSLLFHQK